jgi:hypothetical protein
VDSRSQLKLTVVFEFCDKKNRGYTASRNFFREAALFFQTQDNGRVRFLRRIGQETAMVRCQGKGKNHVATR